MSFAAGVQLSLELSKVFPIRKGIESAASHLIQYVRDLRKSGSDILVEEDLAAVFGRGRIAAEIEAEFRNAVKGAKIVHLNPASPIALKSGPGPTMVHAFQDPRYFSTVVQLSLLGWTHDRGPLASALADTLRRRFEMGIYGATAPPDYGGILGTLTACSSQSVSFAWDNYIQAVEAKLQTCDPYYHSSSNYLGLSPAVLLGALDYLYLVQQLPENRRIILSTALGFVTLIIWAHYVLGLNVVVNTNSGHVTVFGDKQVPHMMIMLPKSYGTGLEGEKGVHIQLFDDTMSVMLESSRDNERFRHINGAERHKASGYGTTLLRRIFNQNFITTDVDPIYGESVNLATALAIRASQQIDCDSLFLSEQGAALSHQRIGQEMPFDIWRVLSATKVLFAGLGDVSDTATIDSYVELLSSTPLDQISLPEICTGFLDKVRVSVIQRSLTKAAYLLNLRQLATVILLLAHVADIEGCKDMPIRMNGNTRIEMTSLVERISRDPGTRVKINSHMVFESLFSLLSSDPYVGPKFPFLCCDFGWSIFLDTIGDKDPAHVRRDLIHIQKGIPTDVRTNEQKNYLRDGPVQMFNMHDGSGHVIRGTQSRECIPRAAATIQRRTEYWNSRVEGFELLLYFQINQSLEWREQIDLGSFTEYIGYAQMHDLLWHTLFSTPCNHEQYDLPTPIELESNVVAVLGWNIHGETEKDFPEKIRIYLTRGESGIRWLAIKDVVWDAQDPQRCRRNIMLRVDECCDKCALEQTASYAGKWVLIL